MPNSRSVPFYYSAVPDANSVPAPVTVLRPAISGTDAHFGTTVAARLTATYSKPGDLLVALDHEDATALAAIWLGRRAALIVTDRHRQEQLSQALETRLDPTRRTAARVIYAPAHDRTAPLRHAPGRVHLIVAAVPEPPADARHDSDLHRLLSDCATAVHPRGVIALQVPSVDAAGRFSDTITTVIAAARSAGLIYHEHLIAIRDCLYPPSAAQAARTGSPSRDISARSRTHADLLILAAPGAIYV